MKNVMIALVLGASAFACADDRPAASPDTTSTSMTTSSTSATTSPAAPSTAMQASGTTPTTASDNGNSASAMPANGTTSMNSPAPQTGMAPATNTPPGGDPSKNVDNTKQNERDRHGAALTPMDQGGGNDRDITAAVRRSVVADGSLSFNAKNVKIITVGGKVTLRGPVKSDAEKSAIEAKASATAGVSSVDNQLEVKK